MDPVEMDGAVINEPKVLADDKVVVS